MENNIEARKLALEERRLDEEIKLQQAELILKREQFESNVKGKGLFSQIFSPVGVGVIAALIGLCGTAASGLINAYTESRKQEASLILKLSEIPDEKVRARNLLFFAQGGYLNFKSDYIRFLREKAELKEGEQVPPPFSIVTSEVLKNLPESVARGLAKDYSELSPRFQAILAKSEIDGFPGLRGKELYEKLNSIQKARLLIFESKMADIQLPSGRALFDYVMSITSLGEDRLRAIPDAGLQNQLITSGKFDQVNATLQKPPSGYSLDSSFKTKVRPGSVQVTFFRSDTRPDEFILEIDVD